MVNTSKVLTVSYGTFSCTLEGFDDSFDTMKAIAEYFRDLAADDRYFGAEPPTPDADMLARIAEREVSRRVEAHQEGDNFVLRTALPVADVIAENDAPAEEPVEENELTADTARDEEEAAAIEDVSAEEARVAAEAAQRAEARAARRARIAEEKAAAEAAEADAKSKRDAEDAAKAEADAKEAEQARLAKEQSDAEAAKRAKEQAELKAAAKREQERADAEAEAALKAEAERVAEVRRREDAKRAQAEADAKRAQEDQSEPDSVAAKLARIRAVVGQPVAAPAASDFSEDEHSDDIMQGQPGDTDLEDILELDDTSAAEPTLEVETNNDATQNAIAGVMSKLATDVPAQVEDTLEETADDIKVSAQSVEETVVEQIVEPAEAEVAKAPIRARVIKMKREEFEAAIASGDIEEDDEDGEVAQTQDVDTSLSRDDEDELARELAAVEAELEGLPAEDAQYPQDADLSDEFDEYEDDLETAARGVDDLAIQPDAEMDRLMDQASSELEEPDGKKRRNALGHLRAAVASARADKKSGPQTEPVDETKTYRDDLQSAVQPRRPVRRLSSDDSAPAAARPPLKLVAEQRVDAPAPVQAPVAQPAAAVTPTPVRPRRIKAGDTPPPAPVAQDVENDLAPEGGTFNEFAEEMGATELPDLLEAAAAYLAYIEGKDQFSRPQLMTKVRMVQEENFSREDGLRSFGQLLRQGKIEKISGGRFTVSDRISFKPDTRAAG